MRKAFVYLIGAYLYIILTSVSQKKKALLCSKGFSLKCNFRKKMSNNLREQIHLWFKKVLWTLTENCPESLCKVMIQNRFCNHSHFSSVFFYV